MTTQARTSVEPSLFLVWLSKTGSCSLTAIAPTIPSRTSSPANALARELVHALEDALAKRALVGAAVIGELAVDEAEVVLAVVVRVGERELEPVARGSARSS